MLRPSEFGKFANRSPYAPVSAMQVLTKKILREYAIAHPETASDVLQRFADFEAAEWSNGADVRAYDASADYVGGDRWVFNIRHNRHRLVVRIFFPARQVYIRFIGTHAAYDRISDITTI